MAKKILSPNLMDFNTKYHPRYFSPDARSFAAVFEVITQEFGAYKVEIPADEKPQKSVFLDTADIAAIQVAADNGIRPQTCEVIAHAKAAEVPPIFIAINKVCGLFDDKGKRVDEAGPYVPVQDEVSIGSAEVRVVSSGGNGYVAKKFVKDCGVPVLRKEVLFGPFGCLRRGQEIVKETGKFNFIAGRRNFSVKRSYTPKSTYLNLSSSGYNHSYILHVDGSSDDKTKSMYAGGVIRLVNGTLIKSFGVRLGYYSLEHGSELAELEALNYGLGIAISLNLPTLLIHTDCENIVRRLQMHESDEDLEDERMRTLYGAIRLKLKNWNKFNASIENIGRAGNSPADHFASDISPTIPEDNADVLVDYNPPFIRSINNVLLSDILSKLYD